MKLAKCLLPALLCCLSVPPVSGQETDLRYWRRLRPPSRGDEFKLPGGVTADLHTGEVFVTDPFKQRIMIFDEEGLFRFEISSGRAFRSPGDIGLDPEGYIYTLAFHEGRREVVQLDFDGRFTTAFALSGLPEGVRPPRLTSLALSPAADRLYLVDSENRRLWVTDRQGTVVSSADLATGLTEEEAEELVLGHVDVYDDTVLVAIMTRGIVELYNLDGTLQGRVGLRGTAPCQTALPVAAALDDQGLVLILDKQRALMMRWDPMANRCLSEHLGFGTQEGAVYQPADMTLDRQGRLYVSQGFEGRVQAYAGFRPAAYPDTDAEDLDPQTE